MELGPPESGAQVECSEHGKAVTESPCFEEVQKLNDELEAWLSQREGPAPEDSPVALESCPEGPPYRYFNLVPTHFQIRCIGENHPRVGPANFPFYDSELGIVEPDGENGS